MTDDRDIPSEAGRRAHVLPNGEVRGSGVGAGGGNPGEDYDPDEHGGDGNEPGLTGVDATTKPTPAQGAGDREPGGF